MSVNGLVTSAEITTVAAFISDRRNPSLA